MYAKPGRTQSQQAEAHGDACLTYAREELANGRPNAAAEQVDAAENWFARARALA